MTSSLLVRLTLRDEEAWQRVVRLLYPLVRSWCVRTGLTADDAADVTQEVFRTLAGNIQRFERDNGKNSFRGWLWGITQNHLRNYQRGQRGAAIGIGGTDALRRIEVLEQPEAKSEDGRADERVLLLRRAVEILRADIEERTWTAFWRAVVEGHSPADIGADLGMTANAVYLIKARLLRRLRDEFGELIEMKGKS
jgi:RNA polymerase sigma-70 factor (ECF subfamily)